MARLEIPKQLLLTAVYFARAIATALFLIIPVTEAIADIYAATLGLVWLATVPLTAGLARVFFGARYLGMLYGLAFLSHQIGRFFGVYPGGVVYDQTGSYALVWYLGVLLGLLSAVIHLPIKERYAPRFTAVTA